MQNAPRHAQVLRFAAFEAKAARPAVKKGAKKRQEELLGSHLAEDKVLIIDNVQENFMLQPHNGIFILSWYDDPNDTALFALTPLLEELAATRPKVHDLLEKYKLEAASGIKIGRKLFSYNIIFITIFIIIIIFTYISNIAIRMRYTNAMS